MASLVQGNNKINNSLVFKIRAIDPYLKKEQEQAVEKLLLGEDVLAILPTGFGKSRIFQAYSHVKDNENYEWLFSCSRHCPSIKHY